MRGLLLIGAVALALCGCEKQGTPRVRSDSLSHSSDEPEASRPVPETPPDITHFSIDCFDVYAECTPVHGLPAVSEDGARIAVPDTGPLSARDEFVLTLRILDSATGSERQALPLLTQADWAEGMDPDTTEPTPALHTEMEARAREAERVLADGQFRPLAFLGTVHEQKPGAPVNGMRATFDGKQLSITQRDGSVRWQRALPGSRPILDQYGQHCGPFPVAEVSVWVRQKPAVVLARVSYTSSKLCEDRSDYLAWR